ncbi:RNA polymerase sigma factor SigJ [Jiangella anatolica]|uniref:RNA polymerase subunit sigma-70 n=1 Tax=Jiangella anatolica TaxID=2670374 RepID=A0A2W2B274_9ACTN|nr:RNA polymerase sigma factor SigJ [Jiangella anatolica]PZF80102.1 RNA polymerase subunit sigma-70 [Jiangella anatolica]
MDGRDDLTARFEAHRGQVRAVAYRMLGSLSEADDAVQEAWLRLSRADTTDVRNLGAWLTTVVGRICLDLLRSRTARREEPLDLRLPDPVISPAAGVDPEQEALLADSVGLAMLVVLDTLQPAERLAFVLHDTFAVPFDDIAPIVGRSADATKMLASRARRRVQAATTAPDADLPRQREVADAFLAAARAGDFDALVAVLDPDVLLRGDHGTQRAFELIRGARRVAENAVRFAEAARHARPVLVNGVPGLVTAPDGRPLSVMAFTIRGGRIAEIDVLVDPDRLARLDLAAG